NGALSDNVRRALSKVLREDLLSNRNAAQFEKTFDELREKTGHQGHHTAAAESARGRRAEANVSPEIAESRKKEQLERQRRRLKSFFTETVGDEEIALGTTVIASRAGVAPNVVVSTMGESRLDPKGHGGLTEGAKDKFSELLLELGKSPDTVEAFQN